MSNHSPNLPQTSLFLRLLGGGYLVYLAWDLRGAVENGPLYAAAVILFALAGLALLGHTLWKLKNHEYFRNPEPKESEEDTEENE